METLATCEDCGTDYGFMPGVLPTWLSYVPCECDEADYYADKESEYGI